MFDAVFISDVHLKNEKDPRYPVLVNFIANLQAKNIILLGDIFDVWVGNSKKLERKYSDFVNVLVEKVKEGCKVYYVEGNHDFELSFFDRTGVLRGRGFSVTVGKLKGYILHGDTLTGEVAHMLWKKFVTSAYFSKAFLNGNLDELVNFAGKVFSLFSHKKNSVFLGKKRLKLFENMFSRSLKLLENFDFVATGHIHIPAIIRTKKGIFLNVGYWSDSYGYFCYLIDREFRFGKIQFCGEGRYRVECPDASGQTLTLSR